MDTNQENIASELKTKDENEELKKLVSLSPIQFKELENTIDSKQKEIEGLFTTLSIDIENDNKAHLENKELIPKIKQYENLSRYWETLNALIGQKNGQKYSQFAQDLTFATLVNNANNILKDLSQRYLLQVRKNAVLQFDVIDDAMAKIVRPVSNLSGGESFIVSLALALGLSKMAGKNVRIDSLFLDEGFGTLDEASLDKVLEVLEKLRTEGKLIGIISHLERIKETIYPQINVVPIARGHSRLSGYGVREDEKSPITDF